MPSHARSVSITSAKARVERSMSVSSKRRMNVPPARRASSAFNSAVRVLPMWISPVGDGAKRTVGRVMRGLWRTHRVRATPVRCRCGQPHRGGLRRCYVTRRQDAFRENTSFAGTRRAVEEFSLRDLWEDRMGKSLLLWLIGIPLPIVLLLYFFVFR